MEASVSPDVVLYEEEEWEPRWRLTVCEVDHNGLVERWFFMEAGTGWEDTGDLLEWVAHATPEYHVMGVQDLR